MEAVQLAMAAGVATGGGLRRRLVVIRLDYRASIVVLNSIIYVLLQAVHSFYITDIFESEGFIPDFRPQRALLSLFMVLVLSFLMGSSRRPSDFFLQLGIVLVIIPSLALYSGSGLPDEFLLVTLGAYLVMALTARLVRFQLPDGIGVSPASMVGLIALATLAFVASIIALGGAQYLNFDFSKIYEFREEASGQLPDVYRYLIPIFTQAVIPFGLAISLKQRKYIFTLLLLVLSVLVFALTANKGPLFFPLFVIAVYASFRFGRVGILLSLGVIAALLASFADLYFFIRGASGGWIGAIMADRILLLPALLNHYYMDFFSRNPVYWWSESRLTFGLIPTPFDLPSPKLIGTVYFPQYNSFANTGWIGSGYAQAGLLGVIIYSLGLGLVLSYVDAAAGRFGARAAICMFAIHMVHMLNSVDFVTNFLTGGLLFSILLAAATGASLKTEEERRAKARRMRRSRAFPGASIAGGGGTAQSG